MSIGPKEQRLTPAERANLVAYLDGELGELDSRAIKTKLSHSPTARREVEALEKTWELLEYLPRPQVSDDFAARTLTGARQLSAEGGRIEQVARRVARRVAWLATGTVASLLAFLLGFLLTHWVWPNPTARLARELPLAEHLDEYREVGSFNFLQQLYDSPEFNAEP